MQQITDPELFKLIQSGNEVALATLFDRYGNLLYRHILRRTGSEFDSEEIVQNIFFSFWQKRDQLTFTDSVYPYLFRAAKYEVINWIVKEERLQLRRAELLNDMETGLTLPAEEVLIAAELEALLKKEVAAMPQTMQQVFTLSRTEQLSVREIAQQLGISEQTVKNNIHLALNRLRLRLQREQYLLVSAAVIACLN